MKYCLSLLAAVSILISLPVLADKDGADSKESVAEATESNATAVHDLCNTYAKEDGIIAAKHDAYVKECMASMTDLSERIQEPLPLVSEGTDESAAAPMSEQVNNDPEQLVKSELVETPDPDAEQLDVQKN